MMELLRKISDKLERTFIPSKSVKKKWQFDQKQNLRIALVKEICNAQSLSTYQTSRTLGESYNKAIAEEDHQMLIDVSC